MGNSVVDNAYYEWLIKRIHYYDTDLDDILETLFSTPFTWDVANDDNRADDGIVLRSVFMSEEGWNTMPCEGCECSILEMMIALAGRIEDDIMWDGERDRTAKWFWVMFNNLGLKDADDIEVVYDILDRFMYREYEPDGTGGLFPLGDWAQNDQREVEIWYQAQLYMMKNYSCFNSNS